MRSHDPQIIPQWVRAFCCMAPSCALIGIAGATVLGYQVGTTVFVALGLLCAKTLSILFQIPYRLPQSELLE